MFNDIRDFYFKHQVSQKRTSKLRKNTFTNYIDSIQPKNRYQANTMSLSKYVMSDWLKYLFTMVDHFTKCGWIITLKDKTEKNVMGALKKCIIILQTDNGTEFKNSITNQFWFERSIQHIFRTPYNSQHQGAVEAFNRTVQNFFKTFKGWL